MNAGLIYGALAFAAGGVLGPLRELLLVPAIGAPGAAMAEAAAMALLLWLAARRVVARLAAPTLRARAAMAGIALALVLASDAALGLLLDASGLSAGRAPRDLTLQLTGLALLAWLVAMPFAVRRHAVAVP
ncbi:hypothetical protein [Roseomonas sp. CECT 9278]|uniref:hypothetical protein n=1 Tax=Roseomonas sp. CECT 9278 TaxID=2845823 RepID=UPI001E5A5A17|nr:hypothetical protein [Roseomonas sp. CECT 9278]CAH0189008.1 hypothetical protein ROS9278_01635 [Roseomonas sp. CECT 9278]